MSPPGHEDQAPGLVAHGAGCPGDGPGTATPDTYVPRMMDLEYTPEEDPSLFPETSWAGDSLEVGAFHELPGSFVEPFDDNNHRVRPIP